MTTHLLVENKLEFIMFMLTNSFVASLRTKHCYWRAGTPLARDPTRCVLAWVICAVPTISVTKNIF